MSKYSEAVTAERNIIGCMKLMLVICDNGYEFVMICNNYKIR